MLLMIMIYIIYVNRILIIKIYLLDHKEIIYVFKILEKKSIYIHYINRNTKFKAHSL